MSEVEVRRWRWDRELWLFLLLSVFALVPLFSPGYFFDAHDADHSVFFLVEFDAAIRDGALWPRWGPDHALGFGYPLWLLYAPLAYFVAEGFHLVGLGFTAAVKATWALGLLFGGLGMLALGRHWWGKGQGGRSAALIGALVYTYAPYHLLTMTVRAALAEFSALAWFPWVILAFDRLVEQGGSRRLALAALALAGLLLTHTGSILIFLPFLAAYLIFAIVRRAYRESAKPLRQEVQDAGTSQEVLTALGLSSPMRIAGRELGRGAVRALAAGLLAAGLAAIFLLPMLLEQRFIVQSQWIQGSYGYRFHFVYPNQFLDPFWGFGFSDDATGPDDGMSFQLGIVAVGLACVGASIGLGRRARQSSTMAFFLAVTLAALALMMPLSQPLWDALGPAALIQFPWRLLGLTAFSLAVLAAGAVAEVRDLGFRISNLDSGNSKLDVRSSKFEIRVSTFHFPHAILALIVVLASFSFTQPQYTAISPQDESPQAIIRFETTYPEMIGITWQSQEAPADSPLVAQYLAGQPLQKAALISGQGQVQTTRVGGASVTALADVTTPSTLLFYTYDFPGWRATVDGAAVEHRAEPPYGLIALDLPAGRHTVTIRHGTTPVRTAGTVISLLGLAIVAVLLWKDP